ncbi:MAG TPA: Rieske 2Fe-2S domain-containing protein [Rhodanobacteraceae bacterium]|nr:Rieske 2Fe-2S domain-containing protein [Rhodanobacteraceae bacterium]
MEMIAPNAPLCRVEDIPDGGVLGLDPADPNGEPLVLARNGNDVRAWLNTCPHTGRRMDYAPNLFLFKNGQLTCAVHGATFALAQNGLCVLGPCRGDSLTSVALLVENGAVYRAQAFARKQVPATAP